ncbi:MAG: DUF4199 family protein [Nonlabens sp.]
MDHIIKKMGLLYGLVGVFVVSGIHIYMWQIRQVDNALITLALYMIPLILGFGAQVHSKFKLSQYITMRQGVLAFVTCVGLIFFFESIVIYLIFKIWDPSMQDVMLQAQNERRQLLIDQGQQVGEVIPANYSKGGFAASTALKFLIYTIAGILMALILKKKRPTV